MRASETPPPKRIIARRFRELITLSFSIAFYGPLPGYAQIPRQPHFDVVSIKSNRSGVTWSSASQIQDKVGRYSARNVTLKSLISWSYDVYDAQIVGGPGWLERDRFDIEAEVDAHPGRDELIQMLRAMLSDRFRLQAHFESRELTRYALMAPKIGLKFGPHFAKADRDCSSLPPGSPGCRAVSFGPESLTMEHTDFGQVARTFAAVLGRVVVDETGIKGMFDIRLDLDLTPPEGAPALSLGDTIMTSLREQIGLRFEERKGPAEVLIVDRAEKPGEN
jgi:uncharacterized protein (TIGR03435 family)